MFFIFVQQLSLLLVKHYLIASFSSVPPFILLVPPNILSVTGAVYTGVQNDEIHGAVSTWVFAVCMYLVDRGRHTDRSRLSKTTHW